MTIEELKCPNCGAPLDARNVSTPTLRCPYCSTEVVLPEELRPREPQLQVEMVSIPTSDLASQPRAKAKPFLLWLGIFISILLFALFAILPNFLSQRQAAALADQISIQQSATAQSAFLTQNAATSTPPPTLTPTPNFANLALRFGEKGIGEGMLSDARSIAVDGSGALYVADYQGGRIQRFDSSGVYQSQWRAGDSKTFILGLSANHAGDVFVAFDDGIARYEGKSGKLLNQWANPKGGSFGDLYAAADGRLAAMWYEGRYGLITSLEGHRENLMIFDPQGALLLEVPGLVSSQTDELALDVQLAVNGAGTIYALSDGVVYQFSPEGKFTDRLTSVGDQAGQFQNPSSFALDGQGRLYLVDGRKIHVLTAAGGLIDDIPTGENIDMLAVDDQGSLWAVARDHVVKFTLRGK